MFPIPAASPAATSSTVTSNVLIVVPWTTERPVHCIPARTCDSGIVGSPASAGAAGTRSAATAATASERMRMEAASLGATRPIRRHRRPKTHLRVRARTRAPIPDRVVTHPVPAPHRTPPELLHLLHQHLVWRPFDLPSPETIPGLRRVCRARTRAVSMSLVLGVKRGAAIRAHALGGRQPVLPSAMRVECGSAVRTHDPQGLEPIVVGHAIDVIEDQRHVRPTPTLVLAAEFADAVL